jgi:hypothetical protein
VRGEVLSITACRAAIPTRETRKLHGGVGVILPIVTRRGSCDPGIWCRVTQCLFLPSAAKPGSNGHAQPTANWRLETGETLTVHLVLQEK